MPPSYCKRLIGVCITLVSLRSVLAAPLEVPSAASFYVPSLPDVHQDPAHPLRIYSGHISSDPNISKAADTDVTPHIFFVLVKNRRSADKERVMFWFNGGPGCSSFDGLMMEVGPWRMDGKGGFKVAEGGWEEYTTMVFVDQPVGTGFSYTSTNKYVHSMKEASDQFLTFLGNFYKVFPEYQSMDTFLGGESFAGQYIPYFADAILNSNLGTPLRGAAIGNGWIDARRQYATYIDFAVKIGLLEENSEDWQYARKRTDECMEELSKITNLEPLSTGKCERLLLDVARGREKQVDGKDMCINIYDVRYDDTKPACGMNWPPDIKPITKYLDRPDVVRALHAQAHPEAWVECRGPVHSAFKESNQNSSIVVLPKVLERIPVLIFAGDQDLICNYVGLESMIQAMTWNGATGLGTVQTQSWSVTGNPAGTWVSSRNLTYAKLFNASHMAPFDLPHVAHDMILRFMGVNFSAIADGTARIPSSIGTVTKPVFIEGSQATNSAAPVSTKTPEQDKAMWEAYYNAGSSALVLVLIFVGIGTFLWCRIRRRRVHLPVAQNEDEHIPLASAMVRGNNDDDDSDSYRRRKGKERATESEGSPIFELGESDDEDMKTPRRD
ncbi:hypothetical protein HGRIS_010080 [Hohenbuehelia grisea]|uniref:Pheromone-processing carboxypeptidase KEX1 n=1 Tax=Hohenbuehelia grisea TaxID=104357 RepID=A0ABR3J3F1_9AGAR